jgi:hypothetical protein
MRFSRHVPEARALVTLLFDDGAWTVELSLPDSFLRSRPHPTAIEALNEVVPPKRVGPWMAELADLAARRQDTMV